MASSSSSSASAAIKEHDVFLSFRGEDTRYSFTSFLDEALKCKGINVFIDNNLKRGDEISPSLYNAIEESMISVIIFSKKYASSRWCLQELLKILECKAKFKQVVLPVFYKVEPSDVRKQTGAFGGAFDELAARVNDEVQTERWSNALREAANLSGWTLDDNMHQPTIIYNIVKEILEILDYMSPSDYKDLVGIKPIIDDIESLVLHDTLINIGIFGIWGMGGIGKTTIAKVIFNRIKSRFEDSYFALNVREKSRSSSGLIPIRQELLSTILKDPCSNIDFAITKRRLGRKRVVIVFDDVTSLTQIQDLIGNLDCLGPGSRVIITTRDTQVLKNCGIDDRNIYFVEGLSDYEALKLFSWYAFHQSRPNICYDQLSNEIIKYCQGVPLALKVLGSSLLKKPKEVWKSTIKKLKIIPHEDIHEVLKVSYDGLNDLEQNIFLDIACFFKWENKDFVIEFLDACNFFAESGISVLIDKCLVTILDNNKIAMHDLLQEMGWEIVRRESTKYPGNRSRLWYHEDIYGVLEDNLGTKAIEGICLDMLEESEIIRLEPCALAVMRSKLRFFKLHISQNGEKNINKVHVSESLNFVSTQLRYLYWHGCPMKTLLTNFHPKNLIALEMPHSSLVELWTGVKYVKLKHINLSYSKHLSKIHDLSSVPNLESLTLEGCTSLLEISSSIKCLNKLVILNLRHCKNLQSLPIGIELESLRIIILSHCSNFKMFPEISYNIEELHLDGTAIEELPPSIENLSKLVILNLKNCSTLVSLSSNICKLNSLEHLDLFGCSKLDGLPENLGNLEALKVLRAAGFARSVVPSSIICLRFLMELNLTDCYVRELPSSLGQLSSLGSLILGRNNFECIPTSIIELSKLSYLDLSYCQRLKSLPELPCHLQNIDAHSCTSLEASSSLSILFSRTSLRNLRVNFSNCFKLDQNLFSKCFKLDEIAVREILIDAPQETLTMGLGFYPKRFASVCFPGNEIPEWFTHQSPGSLVTLEIPADQRNRILDFIFVLCAVVEFRNYCNEGQPFVLGCDCVFKTGDGTVLPYHGTLKGWDYGNGPDYVNCNHVFMGYGFPFQFSVSKVEDQLWNSIGKKMTIAIRFYVENLYSEGITSCNVKKCGVKLSYRQHMSFYYPTFFNQHLRRKRKRNDSPSVKPINTLTKPSPSNFLAQLMP